MHIRVVSLQTWQNSGYFTRLHCAVYAYNMAAATLNIDSRLLGNDVIVTLSRLFALRANAQCSYKLISCILFLLFVHVCLAFYLWAVVSAICFAGQLLNKLSFVSDNQGPQTKPTQKNKKHMHKDRQTGRDGYNLTTTQPSKITA